MHLACVVRPYSTLRVCKQHNNIVVSVYRSVCLSVSVCIRGACIYFIFFLLLFFLVLCSCCVVYYANTYHSLGLDRCYDWSICDLYTLSLCIHNNFVSIPLTCVSYMWKIWWCNFVSWLVFRYLFILFVFFVGCKHGVSCVVCTSFYCFVFCHCVVYGAASNGVFCKWIFWFDSFLFVVRGQQFWRFGCITKCTEIDRRETILENGQSTNGTVI